MIVLMLREMKHYSHQGFALILHDSDAGSHYLVAPVLEMGARNRSVYFPGGPAVRWRHLWNNKEYQGGDEKVWPCHLIRVFVQWTQHR